MEMNNYIDNSVRPHGTFIDLVGAPTQARSGQPQARLHQVGSNC